jgi:hypothetical protein
MDHTGTNYTCPIRTKVVATKAGVVKSDHWGSAYRTHTIIELKDSSSLSKIVMQINLSLQRKGTIYDVPYRR